MHSTTIVIALIVLFFSGTASAGYTDNGNGTVTDTATSLMWQQQDDGLEKIWAEAMPYCEGLSLGGHDDWRTPSVKELKSIIDTGRIGRQVDTRYFLNTKGSHYWTSTTTIHRPDGAWGVSLAVGKVERLLKSQPSYVLCVR